MRTTGELAAVVQPVGEEFRGSLASFMERRTRSASGSSVSFIFSFNSARFAAYWSTIRCRFFSRSIIAFLAMCLSPAISC